jgi:uncharacterized membrane protein
MVTAAVAVITCAAAAAGAPAAVMTVPGVALMAAPGYLWAEVLVTDSVTRLERVAVAAGLALAVPVLGGLALSATGVPLHRTAWVALLAGVTLAGDAVVLARRRRATAPPPAGRSTREAGPAATRPLPAVRRFPAWHAVTFGAAVLIAAGGVGLARAGAAMQHEPAFTQLWLSPRGGSTTASTASLGITNDEGRTTRYRLVLTRHGRASATWNVSLANGQTWQRPIAFSSSYPISASLYRLPDLAHPYRHVATDEQAPGR